MRHLSLPQAQRGATLVVGLIMLVLITLMVTSAFMMSTSNLKSVGNMQFRDEAIAAANKALEDITSTNFLGTTSYQLVNVDIDNDGTNEYEVKVEAPVCVRAYIDVSATISSLSLPGMSTVNNWWTIWDIQASVTDPNSGASVRVHSGVNKLLTQSQKDTYCH